MAKIQYENKVALLENADIPDINKITDDDMNEIKQVVNENDDKFLTNGLNVSNEVDEDYRVNLLYSKNLLSTSLELGTFTNSGAKDTSTTNYRTANMVKVKPNTTYTTSINGTAQAYAVYFYTAGGVHISSATTATFTTPANCEYLNFRCFNADFTSDFATLKVQLEEGSTATAYKAFIPNKIVVDNEKYTDTLNVGSIVDNRSRVNVLKSKNMYDLTNVRPGIYIVPTTGATDTNNAWANNINIIKVEANKTYTFSTKNPDSSSGSQIEVNYYNGDTWLSGIQQNQTSGATLSYTFTTPNNCNGIRVGYRSDRNRNDLQLEEGDTATTYEPYSRSIVVDNEEIYSKPVVLWQNSSPTSDMANNASINLSTNDYNSYEVLWVMSTSDNYNVFSSGRIPKGKSTILNTARCASGGTTNYERPINYNSDTLLKSGIPYSATASARSATASVLIPYMILGWK